MNSIQQIEDIRKELWVNDKGEAFATRRGVARLTGIHHGAIQKLLEKLADSKAPELFSQFQGIDFSGGDIPDTLVALIIQYYAIGCQERYRTEDAKKILLAFAAIGFRTWVQQELGWKKAEFNADPLTASLEVMLEMRKKQVVLETKKAELEKLSRKNQKDLLTVAKDQEYLERAQNQFQRDWLTDLSQQRAMLEFIYEERLRALDEMTLVPATEGKGAKELSKRAKINIIVRAYCQYSGVQYRDVYNSLYLHLKYRYSYDVKARARNSGKSYLDQIEGDGYISDLLDIAVSVLRGQEE